LLALFLALEFLLTLEFGFFPIHAPFVKKHLRNKRRPPSVEGHIKHGKPKFAPSVIYPIYVILNLIMVFVYHNSLVAVGFTQFVR
jgi:hypothetical protein